MELVIVVLFVLSFILGLIWAKRNIISDVAKLYSTRPLNSEQVARLNIELKELAAELKRK